jgi:uncharacterized membrane-anchored protein YitT (DUF2179 family)
MTKTKSTETLSLSQILLIIAGSAMFAASVNWFVTPIGLYAGGIVGTAQLLRTVFFPQTGGIDVAGILNFLFNVPLFILAYRSMNRRILLGTVLSLIVQTLALTFLPVPSTPILGDTLSNIVVAGIVGGIGCGTILSGGASGGGLDLLGIYITQKARDFSVGRLSVFYNSVLYALCAVLFSLSTAVYSVIYIFLFAFCVDKFHLQNIEMELMIFTHDPEVKQKIMQKYVRGVTCWKGMGAYTGKDTEVLVTVVAKSEVERIKKDILEIDPKAFIIVHEGTNVTGGYEKRLL